MPKVVMPAYSTFHDVRTGVQFSPVLDKSSGCYIAVADVSQEQTAAFAGRPGFFVVSEERFHEQVNGSTAPEPSAPVTGDPLTDAAGAMSAPPPPPPSGGKVARPMAVKADTVEPTGIDEAPEPG